MNVFQGEFPGGNTVADGFAGTAPVRSFPPNAYGLYETSGNVWEWAGDWYGDYPTTATTNPMGPQSGSGRVVRGGSWDGTVRIARVAYRLRFDPSFSNDDLGFRLVRTNP